MSHATALSTMLQLADLGGAAPLWEGDVVVVGGGSAGSSAAVAAARGGATTLLVEGAGFLGGTGAAVLDTFYGFFAPGAADRVVGGIGWELCERLLGDDQAFLRPNTYGAGTGVTYEPDHLKYLWDDLCGAAGVATLLHTTARAVVMDGTTVVGVVVHTRGGPNWVRAHTFVDATGDADLAWFAGAALEMPSPERKLQPLTATFRLGNVDLTRVKTAELHHLMQEAADAGEYDLPRREGSVHRTVLPAVVHTNLTRVSGVDATDPWALSRAERVGRRQILEYTRFLRDRVPGFGESYLVSAGVRIGVRETRRLLGEYVLTREDVMSAADFPDSVARCGAPLEDHDGGESTVWEYIGGDQPNGKTYGVPFRCLLPREVEGLVVAGRCLSATHDAHASVRSMAQCMATGQAAGTAAALAGAAAVPVRSVDLRALRTNLTEQGALL